MHNPRGRANSQHRSRAVHEQPQEQWKFIQRVRAARGVSGIIRRAEVELQGTDCEQERVLGEFKERGEPGASAEHSDQEEESTEQKMNYDVEQEIAK